MGTLRSVAGACVAVGLAFGATQAYADNASDAEALFRSARKLATSGDWAGACPKFAESERLDPAPGTLLNLADCEEHFGALIKAREHFTLAASAFRQADKGRAVALERAEALGKRIAHLKLRLEPSVPAGAIVKIDGVVVDPTTLGQDAEIDPGARAVVVSMAGHEDRKYELQLPEGQHAEQALDVGPVVAAPSPALAPPPAVPPEPLPPPAPSGRAPIGVVLAGLGAASLVAGAITGSLAIRDGSTARDDCNTSLHTCSKDGHDAAVRGGTMATVSDVTFLAGGVLAAAGLFLWLWHPKEASSGAARVVPAVTPGGVAAMLERTF